MLFASDHNMFTFLKLYCNDRYMGIGSLECNVINDHVMPFAASAIDDSFSKMLIKLYSEILERTRIGFNTFNQEECLAINLFNGDVEKIKRCYLGYGYNEKFGVMDTTGTASGQASKKNIDKAINELIEKNELGIFWYKGLGKVLDVDERMINYLNQIGLLYDKRYIRIFIANNLSSRFTVIIILFDEGKKVVSTGISSNENIFLALNDAVMEAHLIKHNSLLNRVEKEYLKDSEDVYKYVEHLYEKLEKVNILGKRMDVNSRPNWLESIQCAILNNKMSQRGITIRIFSKDLINCLPTKKNIKCCNNTIVMLYDLNDNDGIPECIVV